MTLFKGFFHLIGLEFGSKMAAVSVLGISSKTLVAYQFYVNLCNPVTGFY